ncbi:MAG: beta-propeller fold lactonase family protein, partial [Negativicutes bacterium]|nr:beta-propeller fold lactonase family protein [Negativicutes bacterium]
GQIAAGQNLFERLFPYTETATPDGHYVYVTYQAPYNDGTFQHLLIFDIVNSTATLFNLDKYAIGSYNQFQPVISPDGKFLVLRGNQFNYPFATQLDVFDINTNPKVPRLVGAVTVPRNWRGTAPYPPDMFSYQILGNYLFVVSHFSNAVMTFNFKPANNDFRPISIYTLPGNSNSEAGKIAVSPDGNYLYVASNADDMVLVLDPNKLVENQDPLITTLASTDAVFAIAVSPVPPPPVSFKTRQRPQASARQ